MSGEERLDPEFAEGADAEAPTERDPHIHAVATPGMPARGVALSVLWWLEAREDAGGEV